MQHAALILGALTCGALTCGALSAWAEQPEAPVLTRSLAPIRDMQFDHPHLPPLRTSRDGRIGLNMKRHDGGIRFSVIAPEMLTAPFDRAYDPTTGEAPVGLIRQSVEGVLSSAGLPAPLRHATLCDAPGADHPAAESGTNPRACGENDCYDLILISTVKHGTADFQLVRTPITVEVAQPKSASADIVSVLAYWPQQTAGPHLAVRDFVEPMITADGRMLVARIGRSTLAWTDADGAIRDDGTRYDIVYAADPSAPPCDLAAFADLKPISHAPFDPALRDGDRALYGIADRPFLDGEGNPIPDGAELLGTYPWIDRAGNTLFFTAVSATLSYATRTPGVEADDWPAQTRYPATCVVDGCTDPVVRSDISPAEDVNPRRGVTLIGRWTRGKMVLLDNAINHADYGLFTEDAHHRYLDLYADAAPVRVGAMRGNGGSAMPDLSVTNSTFMDSLENLFNGDPDLRPVTPRDVVWRLNTGHGGDEVIFDDYLDPNALIVSEMAGSLVHDPARKHLTYFDGFVPDDSVALAGSGLGGEVRMQNAATATVWTPPAHGRVVGGARLEPVAQGGIVGKGLWLDGLDDALVYPIPAQPQAVDAAAWYVGLFIDGRFPNDDEARRLITWPDASYLDVVGRRALEIRHADGRLRKQIPLPAAWRVVDEAGDFIPQWSHVGIVSRPSQTGNDLEIYVDGMLTRFSASAIADLQIGAGEFRVGAVAGSAGFRGWIDEVKVLAHAPGPEVLCNHARGTLAALSDTASAAWFAIAEEANDGAHARITNRLRLGGNAHLVAARYVCFHDYRATGPIGVRDLEAGMTSVRAALLFPEGPIVGGLERPDSRQNTFCLSCHVDDATTREGSTWQVHPDSLSVAALAEAIGVPAWIDPRRQPLQPPARVFGHLPAELFDPPAVMETVAPRVGTPVDGRLSPDPAPGACQHVVDGLTLAYDAMPGIDPDRLSLDLYVPDGPAEMPTVVYVHGGWFVGGDKSDIGQKAALFNAAGYVFVSVNYRLSGTGAGQDGVQWPAHPQDVARALVWLRDNAADHCIDPARIGLMGHSAGAQIVSDVSTNPNHFPEGSGADLDLVRCTVSNDIFAYDLLDYLESQCANENDGPQARCAKYNVAFAEADRAAASPMRNAQPEMGIGPFLVVHGTTGGTAGWHQRQQSLGFVAALQAAEVPAEDVLATGLDHEEATAVIAIDEPLLTPHVLGFFDACLQ